MKTYHTLDDLIFAVMFLHFEQVVAEVQDVEASLLTQQGDNHTACPVQTISKTLPVDEQDTTNVNCVQSMHSSDRLSVQGAEQHGETKSRIYFLGHSLHSELVGSYRDAVNKLHGTPQTVKLHTLVHMHHAIAG